MRLVAARRGGHEPQRGQTLRWGLLVAWGGGGTRHVGGCYPSFRRGYFWAGGILLLASPPPSLFLKG